jgi:hypothetical protein
MKQHSMKGVRTALALEADMSQPIRGQSATLEILDDPIRRRRKRHRRPIDALDPTPPLFEDLPRLIYCPRRRHFVPVAAFGRNKNRPSGLATYCKECRKQDAKSARANPKHASRRLIRKTLRKLDQVVALLADLSGKEQIVLRGNRGR